MTKRRRMAAKRQICLVDRELDKASDALGELPIGINVGITDLLVAHFHITSFKRLLDTGWWVPPR